MRDKPKRIAIDRIAKLGAPRRLSSRGLTATEKRMWNDYAKALKAKTPKVALNAWARKYNVQLKRGNRVAMVMAYKGEGPPPRSGQTAAGQTCDNICHIRKFERYGGMRLLVCTFEDCFYSWERHSWICLYHCFSAAAQTPD
jgi:hypothetical protein